jgi:hypothetical protein
LGAAGRYIYRRRVMVMWSSGPGRVKLTTVEASKVGIHQYVPDGVAIVDIKIKLVGISVIPSKVNVVSSVVGS